jgi:hypothetical protein
MGADTLEHVQCLKNWVRQGGVRLGSWVGSRTLVYTGGMTSGRVSTHGIEKGIKQITQINFGPEVDLIDI